MGCSLGVKPDYAWNRPKVSRNLAGLVLFCETRSCHARRHNDLEGHSNFSSTILYSVLWNITTESGDVAESGLSHAFCIIS